MVHFNNVLGATASILITSSGGNLVVFRATGKVFLNKSLTVLANLHYSMLLYYNLDSKHELNLGTI